MNSGLWAGREAVSLMSACVPGTRLETELITSNMEQEDNAETSAPRWTEGVGNNEALPLHIHSPADAVKAEEEVYTEWLLAEQLFHVLKQQAGREEPPCRAVALRALWQVQPNPSINRLLPPPPPLASHSCRGRPSFWQLPPR